MSLSHFPLPSRARVGVGASAVSIVRSACPIPTFLRSE